MAPKKDTNKRTIAPGKILNLPDFPKFIISILTLQGFLGFVAIDELVYDELVYEFYDNLSWETKVNEDEEETPFLKSRVKNKTIKLGIEEICDCFDIVDNRDGFETYDRHGWGIKGDTLASCIDKLHNGVEYYGIVRPKREFLNVNQQILLKILKECLLPTGSNDSFVGMLECAIFYLLEVESLVRFPMMMMNHMWIHKGYGQLPYGMTLTKVFRRAKIKLEKYQGRNYEYKKMDATSLRRSKIFQHFDGFHTEASYNRISVEERNRWRREHNLSKFASSSSSNPRPRVEVPPRASSMPRSRSTHAKIDPSLKKYMDEKIAQVEESITKKVTKSVTRKIFDKMRKWIGRPKSSSSSSSSLEEKKRARKKSKGPIIEEIVEEDPETINEENLQKGIRESLAEHCHSISSFPPMNPSSTFEYGNPSSSHVNVDGYDDDEDINNMANDDYYYY
ncbi:unnamed protein product [Cuscuta campestris]|uniref:Uncharacterized protein n=1 Tax=Cuscuta campestris TaxID=132261 RepID=A0A484M782_9ASTE|nr:unnamed protein product [Cuscuta campestris]